MGAEVLAFHELDRVRRNQRQAEFASQVGRLPNNRFLLRLTVALHFKVESAGENSLPGLCPFAGQLEVAVKQGVAHITEMPSGKCQQTITTDFGEPFPANLSSVTPIFNHVGLGQKFAQLLVASPVARQQK